MFRHSLRFMTVGVAAVAAMATVGCSQKQESQDQGSAQVSVHALSLAADVKAVDVTVSGGGITTPMALPMFKQADGSWKGLINHIPTGTGRTFSAAAYDSTAKTHQIYSGSTGAVTITKNQIADVIVVLTENTGTDGFANHAPVVTGLSVSSTAAQYGDKVAYTLKVSDQDSFDQPNKDKLTFAVVPSCGTFAAPSITTDTDGSAVWAALWTAPATNSSCQINATVTDTKGAKAVAVVTIDVSAGADMGGAKVSTVFESYPVITNLTSTQPFVTPGTAVGLAVDASMSDNEAPSYAWTSSCGNYFDNASSATPGLHASGPVVGQGLHLHGGGLGPEQHVHQRHCQAALHDGQRGSQRRRHRVLWPGRWQRGHRPDLAVVDRRGRGHRRCPPR
jgi:hypothetical protein